MNRLFVYGIFLSQHNRDAYGMTNPRYDTVLDYATFGYNIVQAEKLDERLGLALSGLVVDVDPSYWDSIDNLETGYERITIETTSKVKAYMYARRSHGQE